MSILGTIFSGGAKDLVEGVGGVIDNLHTSKEEKLAAEQKIKELDNGNGVLILTDIYGATPCNLLKNFIVKNKVEVITGINLPMLIKAISDRKDNLKILLNDSLDCAKKNIKII